MANAGKRFEMLEILSFCSLATTARLVLIFHIVILQMSLVRYFLVIIVSAALQGLVCFSSRQIIVCLDSQVAANTQLLNK